MGDDKPFCCTSPGCGMCFANEDHLTVHLKKHEMSLSLNTDNGSSKSNSLALFVDQTPTPTRFIRNCEEVGLFQDLQNVNPFEEHFRKAVEATKAGNPPAVESSRGRIDTDILHTPSVLAADLEAVSRIVTEGIISSLDSPVPSVVVPVDSVLNDKGVMFCDTVTNDVDDEVSIIATSASSPVATTSLVNSGLSDAISFCGVSEDLSILPTTESLPTLPVVTTLRVLPKISAVSSLTTASPAVTMVTQSAAAPVTSAVVGNPTTVVQLILKLPDGRSIPVSIPTMPVVAGPAVTLSNVPNTTAPAAVSTVLPPLVAPSQLLAASIPPVSSSDSSSSSIAKLKLRQALTANQIVIASSTASAIGDQHISSAPDFFSIDSISNDSDSHDGFPFQKKRRSGEDDPDEKRRRFLERNRAAATRCRQKRKQWVQNLENKADELNTINQQLLNEVSMLRNEVAQLKSMLLAHKDCPVTQQQQKNLRQLNGLNSTSSTFIIHKGGNTEVIQITPAEAIASSALTHLAQTMDGGTVPVILRTVVGRPQAVDEVVVSGSVAATSVDTDVTRPEVVIVSDLSDGDQVQDSQGQG